MLDLIIAEVYFNYLITAIEIMREKKEILVSHTGLRPTLQEE
jgi:hypothetical protein